MAFEQLWNGWRSNYVEGVPRSSDPPRDGRSVFTAILESGEPDEETHIVQRGEWCFAILNAFPYASGHVSGLWYMITGAIGTCNLSGPIGIAETSGSMASQGTTNFIWFIAVLSTAVGLLNLFPIPVLDGGHLVFHAYEAVTGRPPSDKALRVLMAIGLTLLLSLMLFALYNDLFCP